MPSYANNNGAHLSFEAYRANQVMDVHRTHVYFVRLYRKIVCARTIIRNARNIVFQWKSNERNHFNEKLHNAVCARHVAYLHFLCNELRINMQMLQFYSYVHCTYIVIVA